MNRIFIAVSLTLILCSTVLSALAIGQDGSQEAENSRFETACPPSSDEAREKIESEIAHVLGDQLREHYGKDALPLNASVELLIDSKHRDTCEYFTRVHKRLINSTTRLPGNAEQTVYEHSVAYFEAGAFYFVLIDTNPKLLVSHDPRLERVATSMVTGMRVYLKDNLDRVSDQKGFVYGPEHRKLVNKRIRDYLENQQ